MIAEGNYKAVVVTGSASVCATAKGKEYVGADFRITEGEMAGEVVQWSGWLTEKAIPYTAAQLKALGWDGRTFAELGPLDKEVSIEVEHNVYNGRTTAKVGRINVARKAEAKAVSALDARLKAAQEKPAEADDANPFVDD